MWRGKRQIGKEKGVEGTRQACKGKKKVRRGENRTDKGIEENQG